jgi:hypothetical protein
MKIKSSPEIALLKTLTTDHWWPQTDGVMNFLSRDDAALLASNPRLYRSARERARYIKEDGGVWLPRVR